MREARAQFCCLSPDYCCLRISLLDFGLVLDRRACWPDVLMSGEGKPLERGEGAGEPDAVAVTQVHCVLADPDRWLATLLAFVSFITSVRSLGEVVAVFEPRVRHPQRRLLHATQHRLGEPELWLGMTTEVYGPVVSLSSSLGSHLCLGLGVKMDVHASGLVEEEDADEIVIIWDGEPDERRWRRVVDHSRHH